MKQGAFFLLLAIALVSGTGENGESLMRRIHREHAGKWFRTLTFVQHTEMYKEGVRVDQQTWFEAGCYPNLFRIDFGDPDSGNTFLCRNDSAYLFQHGKLKRALPYKNELLFLLGGLYHLPEDTVIRELYALGFDLKKSADTLVAGRRTHIFGASRNDTLSNQFWMDAERHCIVRILQQKDGDREDIRLSGHVQLPGGWCETEVLFYTNGILKQTEQYSNCRGNVPLDPRIFEPAGIGKIHWLTKPDAPHQPKRQ